LSFMNSGDLYIREIFLEVVSEGIKTHDVLTYDYHCLNNRLVLVNSNAFDQGFMWYLALMSADVAAALFAATACNARLNLALLVPFYRMGYGFLLQGIALIAFIDESRRAKMTWS